MPLCCTEVEQISREDLVELSEIEKHNLGQVPFLFVCIGICDFKMQSQTGFLSYVIIYMSL